MSNILRCIHGHTSPETAYVFEDWPSGFRGRVKRRVFLEFKKGKGFRYVSQTTNFVDSDDWNKPHASTYSEVGVMVWAKCDKSPTGETLTWTGLSLYDNAEKVAKFEKNYAEAIAADENVRKQLAGIKLTLRIQEGRSKLNRIFENAVKHLDGTFCHAEFVKLFEGDDAFGFAIAEKWEAQTEGVGVIKDWVRAEFKVFMDAYHAGFLLAKASKPEGYKMLVPRMDTVQEGDLRYFPPYIKEWTPVEHPLVAGMTSPMIGQMVQSVGYWARKKTNE